MKINQSELEFENVRLGETITLAKEELEKARLSNEGNEEEIISLKYELGDDSTHSVANLWNSQNFEDLVELSQYTELFTKKVSIHDTVASRIGKLERLITSPYFARIDFKFDSTDTLEKIYIGRSSLVKKDTYDILVYDWRSPVASVFYRFTLGRASYEAPAGKIEGEVTLKRQYEIHNGVLEYFFDADIQIVDEFLRKMLSQNTSSKMKTIVETIQKEQDIVIRDMDNDLMMVQGVAGSGKTSIALHRAAYLMYQGLASKLFSNNILIISPTTLFEQYISNVLPELGEDNVVSVVFEDILETLLPHKRIQTRNQFLEILIGDTSHHNLMKSSMEFKTSALFLEMLNRLIDDLPDKWLGFNDMYYGGECIVKREKLKEKVLSGSKYAPLTLHLKELKSFTLEALREALKKKIDKKEYLRVRKEIQALSEIDEAAIYRKLFNDESYFLSLGKGLELPDNILDVFKFTKENLNGETLYYDDATVLAYLTLKLRGTDAYRNIKQVVIDEAQDYYPLHYEIIQRLFSFAKYTVLGDINQTLEKEEDLSLYDQIGSILNKEKSTLVTMDKSFRCTNEILEFSSKFISQKMEIKSFNRSGDKPELYCAANQSELYEKIILETGFCQKAGYGSIGIICKTEENARRVYEGIKDSIKVHLIDDKSTEDLQGIFIIPVYMSKGLEFDAVLIGDVDDKNYQSEDDKKLLYIACTRALHRLNLFCEGEESSLLR